MVGLKARAVLWATATEISSTGSTRARPKQPAGSCGQLFGRSEPLFKRPTRASNDSGVWGSDIAPARDCEAIASHECSRRAYEGGGPAAPMKAELCDQSEVRWTGII